MPPPRRNDKFLAAGIAMVGQSRNAGGVATSQLEMSQKPA